MKKIDEIMELLTEEISGFNASLSKLEELSKNLNNLKIQADASNIEFYIKDFLKSQKRTLDFYTKQLDEIHEKIGKGSIRPKWEAKVIYLLIGISTIAFSYLSYNFIEFENKKETAFLNGKKESAFEVIEYFNDHPIIYKNFQKWAIKKDSVPNQK